MCLSGTLVLDNCIDTIRERCATTHTHEGERETWVARARNDTHEGLAVARGSDTWQWNDQREGRQHQHAAQEGAGSSAPPATDLIVLVFRMFDRTPTHYARTAVPHAAAWARFAKKGAPGARQPPSVTVQSIYLYLYLCSVASGPSMGS